MDESERILPKSKIKQQKFFLATRQCENKRDKEGQEMGRLLYGQPDDDEPVRRVAVIAVAFFPVDQARGEKKIKQ